RLKNLAFLSCIGSLLFLFSCEDKGVLNADRNFSRSTLQTVFSDTFAIVTSTTLFDSIPTSNTNTLLIGDAADPLMGRIAASTYFQVGFTQPFLPKSDATYDSVGLVLSYNDYWYGDTTQAVTLDVFELSQTPRPRQTVPYRGEDRVSLFTVPSGFYNTSRSQFINSAIATKTIRFSPLRDSIYIPLPSSFGKRWFDIAKADTTQFFKNANSFVTDFFRGLHIEGASGAGASIAGFRSGRCKIRIFYKTLIRDVPEQVRFDFPVVNAALQFNSLTADRSGTPIATLARRRTIPSTQTNGQTYMQSGIGIGTKIEFPSLKKFFLDRKIVLIDAILEVYPVQNTYLGNFPPPRTLALFKTDNSNVPFEPVPPFDRSNVLSTNIFLDKEYSQETKYTFVLTNYISAELLNANEVITPVMISSIAPGVNTELNRVAIGGRNHPISKSKLKIFYSYVPN
ncbi:MAG: DUF4270 family protein, partial [Flammeovirgaceae bacterium]